MCGELRTFNGDALVVDLGRLGPLLVASVRAPFVAVVREVVLLQPGLKMVEGGGAKKVSDQNKRNVGPKRQTIGDAERSRGTTVALHYWLGVQLSSQKLRKRKVVERSAGD